MKNRYLIVVCVAIAIFILIWIPYKKVIIFMPLEEQEVFYYAGLHNKERFQILYTHSIHRSDVLETYRVTKQNNIQLVSMIYEDLAVGMPGYAEEGQKLEIKNGKYILSYDDEELSEFILFVANIDMDLKLLVRDQAVDLKKALKPGHSYVVKIKYISIAQCIKGISLVK